MRAMALILVLLLPGCGVVQIVPLRLVAAPPPPPPAHVVTCGDLTALAAAIVDGRRRGQGRFEQRLLVDQGGTAAAFHDGMVEAIYDWPRPVTATGWARLTKASVTAASAHCLNRPGATLRGERLP